MYLEFKFLLAIKMQGVIDARTLHQSVRSRLVREQREGLRDRWGAMLPNASRPSPLDSARSRSTSNTIGDAPGGDSSSIGDGLSPESPASVNAAALEEEWEGREGATRWAGDQRQKALEEEDEGEDENADEDADEDVDGVDEDGTGRMGSTKNTADETFSFLTSGFDESDLGGMRTPPFLLPRVVIGDGHVQVTLPLPAKFHFTVSKREVDVCWFPCMCNPADATPSRS